MKLFAFIVVMGFMMCTSTVAAKTPEEKIADLERRIAAIEQSSVSKNQDVASGLARVNTIADEFNSVKGQSESAQMQIKAMHEDLMRLITDLQQRIQSLEERIRVLSTGQSRGALEGGSQLSAEALAYQKALDMADGGQWLEAASAFEEFLDKYPKSKLASNARFWVAECFYSSRDLKRAVKEYQNFIEKHPKDAKMSEALLKQGNSFYDLGLYEESKAFYEKVLSTYPKSEAAVQAKAKLSRIGEKVGKTSQPAASKSDTKKTTQVSSSGQVSGGTRPEVATSAPETTGSPLGAYPEETIEQKRQKMMGTTPAPEIPPSTPSKAQTTPTDMKKPGPPPREF